MNRKAAKIGRPFVAVPIFLFKSATYSAKIVASISTARAARQISAWR